MEGISICCIYLSAHVVTYVVSIIDRNKNDEKNITRNLKMKPGSFRKRKKKERKGN